MPKQLPVKEVKSAYEEATNPYILGEPMGKVAGITFLCIMIGFPLGAVLYHVTHSEQHTSVQGTRK